MQKTILIAEDDPGVQDVLKLIFERAGYHVALHSGGHTLLMDAYELPDLFILDKQLSGVDGLDICRYLKSGGRAARIPVLILSANPHVATLAAAAGADAALEKPFKSKDLLALVTTLISNAALVPEPAAR